MAASADRDDGLWDPNPSRATSDSSRPRGAGPAREFERAAGTNCSAQGCLRRLQAVHQQFRRRHRRYTSSRLSFQSSCANNAAVGGVASTRERPLAHEPHRRHPPQHLPANWLAALARPARPARTTAGCSGASGNVTIAKNRLRHGAINSYSARTTVSNRPRPSATPACSSTSSSWARAGARCIRASSSCCAARRWSTTTPASLAAYAADPADVPVAPILYAPYPTPANPIPLEERPIDLLFIGSMNERRKAGWIASRPAG